MMENAGRILAWHVCNARDGDVIVVAGSGGNGGGGLTCAVTARVETSALNAYRTGSDVFPKGLPIS